MTQIVKSHHDKVLFCQGHCACPIVFFYKVNVYYGMVKHYVLVYSYFAFFSFLFVSTFNSLGLFFVPYIQGDMILIQWIRSFMHFWHFIVSTFRAIGSVLSLCTCAKNENIVQTNSDLFRHQI